MRTYTAKVVVINSILNLIIAILDGFWNLATQTSLSVFTLTNALARTKRNLSTHFTISTALYSVFSIIWVIANPTTQENYYNSAISIANNTFCDISQNYECIIIRSAKEYFFYLASHWFFCEVLRLLIMTNDVFSKFNFGKKSIIIAYALYNIPALAYSYLTCDNLSCWDESQSNIISFPRSLIWIVLHLTVLVMFLAVACLQRKNMAIKKQKTMSLKVIYFFTGMTIMFVIMETLHIVQLYMNIMTTESYESCFALLTATTNFIWTVYSTWNHGISNSIRTCVDRSLSTIKRRENIELTDMSTEGRSKTEEEKQPVETVETISYLETHF